jgi:hypothetical protein
MFYKRVPKLSESQMQQRVLEYLLQIAQENGLNPGDSTYLRGTGPNGIFVELAHLQLSEDIHCLVAQWGHHGVHKFHAVLPYTVDTKLVVDETQIQEMLNHPKLETILNLNAQRATAHNLVNAIADIVSKWNVVQPVTG